MKKWLFIVVGCLLLSGCSSIVGGDKQPSSSPTNIPSPSQPTATATTTAAPTPSPANTLTKEETTDAVVQLLKDKNHSALKQLIHPVKGVLFSPYLYIHADTAQVFKPDALPTFTDDTPFIWGEYDGSGETIKLTFQQYYEKFVYDQDYVNREKLGDDKVLIAGNMVNNIKEVFPDSYLADYHFSGFDKNLEGLDWSSLIIVLEKYEDSWYVVAIVHSAWTV